MEGVVQSLGVCRRQNWQELEGGLKCGTSRVVGGKVGWKGRESLGRVLGFFLVESGWDSLG